MPTFQFGSNFISYPNSSLWPLSQEWILYVIDLFKKEIPYIPVKNTIYHFCEKTPYCTIFPQKHVFIDFDTEPNIDLFDSNNCRIHLREYLCLMNWVIHYNMPNIENIMKRPKESIFHHKMVYIAPLLYEYTEKPIKSSFQYDIITTFSDMTNPRRKKIVDELSKRYRHHNINFTYDKEKLRKLFSEAKIIINLHATDNFSSIEELRVLPALLTNTIVVSEYSAHLDKIMYAKHVQWCTYDDMVKVVDEILHHYDSFHAKLFYGFKDTIRLLKEQNLQQIKKIIVS